MPLNISPLLVLVKKDSLAEVDLVKVIAHYKNLENQNLRYASVNYRNPDVNENVGWALTKGALFFAEQLVPVVDSSRPTNPFYWFKKLYAFYQKPENEDVTLSDAIKVLQAPMIETLNANCLRLFASLAKAKPPLAGKILTDMKGESAKLSALEEMPSQLIEIAQKYGSTNKIAEGPSGKEVLLDDVKSPSI